MKLLVQTNGEFILWDMTGRQEVSAWRPTVVTSTPFIDNHKGKRLTVIEVLADNASDAALAAAKNPEELEAAIAALPRPKPAKKG